MKKKINNFDDFLESISMAATDVFSPILKRDYSLVRDSIERVILNEPKIESKNANIGAREKLFSEIFYGFMEISNTYERLREHEIYINRYPFAKTKITQEKYIRFIIESNINEIYMLKERLKRYVVMVGRRYRNNKEVAPEGVVKGLTVFIEKSFFDICKTRGYHIHSFRYTDGDLDRLNLLTFMKDHIKNSDVKLYYKWEYKEIRNKYKAVIVNNNKTIALILDHYFNVLSEVIFTSFGKFRSSA